MPRIKKTSNRGSSSGRDEQNLDKWLVAPQAKLHYHASLDTIDPILVCTRLQNIKGKVTSLDQHITHIEKYHTRSSRGGDPMDISSTPQNEDDGSDEETDDNEEGSAEEGDQEEEAGSEEEGGQDEEEEEGQKDGSNGERQDH
ncbi:uncharacterized protein LOC131162713 [Malania oleifera]|uniref:uncharacterized protein LOC131162713 n=1 Tax=Malania oleifera TaxID=397392 RepID=UPI0025ADB203|nr:uncharacterized protein LOC131162713 [Malania oleifera]